MAELRAASPAPEELLLFWGHQPTPDGELGPSCLSQWWPVTFMLDGRTYRSAEHWMMWHKAMLFGDLEAAGAVLSTPDPAEAKRIGRRVRDFDEQVWAEDRGLIVVAGSVLKFSDPDLGAYLLSTGDAVLVEASPEDEVWGIGLAADHPDARDPQRWPGQNLLGFALMEARAVLRRRG